MKVTKQQLKQIIKEELEMVKEAQNMEWVDIYVTKIKDHLESEQVEGRGALMQHITALANAAKGEQINNENHKKTT